MDAIFLLTQLLFRSFIFALPVAVAWLAFRRLALSETSNAWLYAITGLFCAFTAAGLAPWVLTGHDVTWLFFVMAPLCPALWLAVVIVCGADRPSIYESIWREPLDRKQEPEGDQGIFRSRHPCASTLILENPDWPDAPTAVFQHHASDSQAESVATSPASASHIDQTASRSVLTVARAMRGNGSSAHRRDRKLLPPPDAGGQTREISAPKSSDTYDDTLPFLRAEPTH